MSHPLECWNLTSAPLPPRTLLFPLEPIAIGTPFVESLTSYVSRLAEVHAVRVSDLVGSALAQCAPYDGPIISTSARDHAIGSGFHSGPQSINGVTEDARRWIAAVEGATGLGHLRFLTMAPLKQAFCRQSLFRSIQAWCPNCFQEWAASQSPVYWPLLWALRPVRLCILHRRPLDEMCPNCIRHFGPLTTRSRPGYCPRCQNWLGRPSNSESSAPRYTDEEVWVAARMADILASMPELEENHLGDILRENLAKLGNKVTNGNRRAFSMVLGFGEHNARGWLGGHHFPRPAVLFRICHRLQIPPLELLRRNGNCAVSREIAAAGLSMSNRGAWRDDPERMKAVLLDALQESPAPNLHEIARRFNYRTCAPLKRLDPDTCKQIARRYRAVRQCWYGTWVVAGRNCTAHKIERILKKSLARERPIPVTQIAAQLGHESPQRLQTHFPELCKAIAQKAAQYRMKFREQMRVALVKAITDEPPPAARLLAKRLKCCQSALEYHFPALCKQLQAARKAWKVAQYEAIRLKVEVLATEMIGATVQEVCLKAGVTTDFLLRNFPALDREIAARYLARENERRRQRHETLRRDVQKAVTVLSLEGLTPTLNRVMPLLSADAPRDWNRIRQEISDATRQLNPAAATVEA